MTTGSGDARPFDALGEVADLLEQGALAIKNQMLPLADAAKAYRTSVGGHVRGKLVLTP